MKNNKINEKQMERMNHINELLKTRRTIKSHYDIPKLINTFTNCGYELKFIMKDAVEREVLVWEMSTVSNKLVYSFTDLDTEELRTSITGNLLLLPESYVSKTNDKLDGLVIEAQALVLTFYKK